MFNNHSDFPDK